MSDNNVERLDLRCSEDEDEDEDEAPLCFLC